MFNNSLKAEVTFADDRLAIIVKDSHGETATIPVMAALGQEISDKDLAILGGWMAERHADHHGFNPEKLGNNLFGQSEPADDPNVGSLTKS